MMFLGLAIGMATTNFAYQYFGDANWSLAIDRTWFQSGAVLACWVTSLVHSGIRKSES